MLCLGAKIFQKITLKTIKLVLKTDKKTDKNRQKPIKLSVSKNYSVGFCRFGKTDKMSTKTDKNRQRGVVGLHPRRKAQLKRKYPEFRIESVRGNLNTRLKKLDNVEKSYETEYSALILARAGLERMARQNETFVGRLSETLDTKTCLYAVGQVRYRTAFL